MNIRQAKKVDIDKINNIVFETIISIYPKYYPKGAVDFFIDHHNNENISNDIESGNIFIGEIEGNEVGTVTIENNEISRLFVLPHYQGEGYGKILVEFCEKEILKEYNKIRLSASLPAKGIYLKRGYKPISAHSILTENGDYLCYDIMEKEVA